VEAAIAHNASGLINRAPIRSSGYAVLRGETASYGAQARTLSAKRLLWI